MAAAMLRPPEAAGLGRGFSFALVAHGLLVLALSYGVSWRSDSSPAFEAELWSAVPQVAAPREEAPPEPEPEAPKPDTRVQQRAAEEEAAEQREAEIAIAKAKKQKEEKAREDAEKREKAAKDKAAKEKAAKEEQDRKKLKDEKAAKDAKEAKAAKDADAKREALRLENLRRIQGMAGGTPGSTGNAAQNAAPSAGWTGKVKGKIKPLIIYSGDTSANPSTDVQVALAPDGRILGSKIIKASGDAEWDRAVLRAIEKAETLPRDTDGRVPSVILLGFTRNE
jgi:colicin import membrane protein